MSVALVLKGLEIVDPEVHRKKKVKTGKKGKTLQCLIPEKHKATGVIQKRGCKAQKIDLLSASKKLTITEVRNQAKDRKEIQKENLLKLKILEEACKISLDDKVTKQIIERAVTRRPVKAKLKTKKSKKEQKTVFTEEDFRKFEEEYTG